MNKELTYCKFSEFTTLTGFIYKNFEVSYQLFGKPLHTAPVVLVIHALTGNSNVAGERGWWIKVVRKKGAIDLDTYTVISINIPGNGYDKKSENLIHNYEDFSYRDIAFIFKRTLEKLNIHHIHSVVGLSLGGGILWELMVNFPNLAGQCISVAADWKTTDWILGYVRVQKQILQNSRLPMHDARMMAMLFFRTPQSFAQKFNGKIDEQLKIPQAESWLLHHARTIENNYTLLAYKMMNHLMITSKMGHTREDFKKNAAKIQDKIVQIGIDSDLLFPADENKITHQMLRKMNKDSHYHEIKSVYGHDAFLIEYPQLTALLKQYF